MKAIKATEFLQSAALCFSAPELMQQEISRAAPHEDFSVSLQDLVNFKGPNLVKNILNSFVQKESLCSIAFLRTFFTKRSFNISIYQYSRSIVLKVFRLVNIQEMSFSPQK